MSTDAPFTTEQPDSEPPSRPRGIWQNVRSLFGGRSNDTSLKESLEVVIEEHDTLPTALDEEHRSLLLNTLDFGDKRIDDVMIPRADIVAVEAGTPFAELVTLFRQESVSRVPVYRTSLDDVVAMVHIKDVFRHLVDKGEEGCRDLALVDMQRPLLFVPPSMRLSDLLMKMRMTRIHMALVVDEYGGTDGLLTIEDLVEQIVGDIEDEHDAAAEELIYVLPNGDLKADARLTIEDLEGLLGMDLLPDDLDEDVDTVGGLIFTLAGHVPQQGDVIAHPAENLRFEVTEGDARRVKTVLILRTFSEEQDAVAAEVETADTSHERVG
ncbi:MAG: magnesium/cobalt efflux protein [Kordiimonas sp.]|nr:magnesium/cobalt efflux protein [Kordiimonas sp.]